MILDGAVAIADEYARPTNTPGYCLQRVAEAYGNPSSIGPGPHPVPDAYTAWVYATDQHPGDMNPPAGVPCFYGPSPTRTDSDKNAGDIVLSIGGGNALCTDFAGHGGHIGVMSLSDRAAQISRPYLGWTGTFLGYQVKQGARMLQYNGVDVSFAQGAWSPPGNIDFAIMNASRANVGFAVGSFYHYQVDRTRQAGKEVGHYFFNGNIDPVACANFFVDNLYDFRVGDSLWLDVEAESGTGTAAWTPARALAFAQVVQQRTGVIPGIYLNKTLENGSDWSACVNFGMRLWSAYYQGGALPALRNWPEVSMIQWTSTPIDSNKAAYTQAEMAGGDDMPSVSDLLNAPAFDNGPTVSSLLKALYDAEFNGGESMPDGLPDKDNIQRTYQAIQAVQTKVDTLSAPNVDVNALASVLSPILVPALTSALQGVGGGSGLTEAQVADVLKSTLAATKIQFDSASLEAALVAAASKLHITAS